MAFVSLFYHKFVNRKFFLPFFHGDKIIHKIEVLYTNIEPKTKKMVSYLNLVPLYEEFARGVHFHADTRIKGVQIGYHKIKQ